MDKTPKSQLHRRNAVPFLVLAVAIMITATATLYTVESIRLKDLDRFRYAVHTTRDSIVLRLETYTELLRGARGLFSADGAVDRQEFHNYVSSLELDRYFPGVQGIGFSRRTSEFGPTEERHRIVLIEPRNERNRSALGYDMFSEAVRREAMARARDTGEPAMSGRVTLKQEIEPEKQAGFLIYLPIYRRGASTTTIEERRAALVGFVYCPFRGDDFFAGILATEDAPRLRLEVWDGQEQSAAAVLHRTPSSSQYNAGRGRFEEVDVLNYAGRAWTVRYQPSIHFERASSTSLVPLIAVGGLIISLLLFTLTSAQARGRREAERVSQEVQRSEEALRQANQAKDEFLAMLGHELRNPLGAISNALQIMTEREVTDPHMLHAREVVERQVRHQTRLIEDLLDVSRVYSGKISLRREVVDLNQTVINAVDGLKWAVEEQGHFLIRHLADEPVLVDGDPVRLEQIVTNLIHNAIKYTPPGGRIEITVLRSPDQGIVRVWDTGVGISSEMLGQIFDVFTQAQISIDRSRGGLGLGLTLVRNLTQMHGGRVEARSPGVGQGSEFVLHFPLLPADRATAFAPAPLPPTPLPVETSGAVPSGETAPAVRPLQVLVVEDLQDARETLQELLELLGHEVETAADGRSGLAKLLSMRPDVALIDIGLPGLDGYEVASRFRAEAPDAPVRLVALTGYGQPEDRARARDAGFETHVVKPIDPESLKQLLSNIATH